MKKLTTIAIIFFFILSAFGSMSYGAEKKPRYGGTLRILRATFPKVIGYPVEFSPVESICTLPSIERLSEWGPKDGVPIPVLAESWEGDPVNKTIIWHLRKGVKFHDGTEFDAEALKWNFQIRIDAKRQPDGKFIKELEVIDKYTLKMHLTEYTRIMMPENYAWIMSISPTAFKNAGGGDFEKSKEWARRNLVATGPFKVVEFKRDNYIKYVRNENYWRPGRPYLDGIESRLIRDPMTAMAMMEAGEADAWHEVGDIQNVLALEKKGFKVNWGNGYFWSLLPNSSDPKSPLANKKVREAIEYAIDRPTVAKLVGQGKFEPLHQLAPSFWMGHVKDFNPRPYNPKKAKQLLAEAGYPNGFKTKILFTDRFMARDGATAIKAYLDAVGIQAQLDNADMGRYFTSIFGTGWSDLAFAISGINPSTTDLFTHFGAEPMTFRTGNIAKTPEYLKMCDEALHTYDDDEYIKKLKQIVIKASEDAMVIPIYVSALATVLAPYVHSDYLNVHSVIWYSYDDWMEEH